MGSLGAFELFVIFIAIILIFGGKKIPELAKSLGKGLKEFRKAIYDLDDESDAPNVPESAATLPPPGAGLSEDNSSENPCSVMVANGPNRLLTRYSIIFSFGLKGKRSSNPIDLTAM